MTRKGEMMNYDALVARNSAYVDAETQERIRGTRLLIAGCGIGSTFAEAAVRLGFRDFILVDRDTVEEHNLNRQTFVYADVGRPKVDALSNRIKAINPEANVDARNCWVSRENAAELVAAADFVIDTIDFISLDGILALHDEVARQGKPAFTGLALGWGAGAAYFPKRTACGFRAMFGIRPGEVSASKSYVDYFVPAFRVLSQRLDPRVVAAVSQVLSSFETGKPCPASQVSPGALSIGGFMATCLVRILAGQSVRESPEFMILDTQGPAVSPGTVVKIEPH